MKFVRSLLKRWVDFYTDVVENTTNNYCVTITIDNERQQYRYVLISCHTTIVCNLNCLNTAEAL